MGNQIARQLGSLPIMIVFDSSGMVGFNRMANFPTIIENLEDGLQIIYSNDDIFLGSETQIEYNRLYQYKEMPEMLYWLKSQELELPTP